MSGNSYSEACARRSAALPERPLLDFVDHVCASCDLDHSVCDEAARDDAFLASVASYRSIGMIPLGYAAQRFFSRQTGSPSIVSELQAVDYVRLASYRCDLPATDPRHLSTSANQWRAAFPDLFPEIRIRDPRNIEIRKALLDTTASFAAEHPLRLMSFAFSRTEDEAAYVDYWLARSEGSNIRIP